MSPNRLSEKKVTRFRGLKCTRRKRNSKPNRSPRFSLAGMDVNFDLKMQDFEIRVKEKYKIDTQTDEAIELQKQLTKPDVQRQLSQISDIIYSKSSRNECRNGIFLRREASISSHSDPNRERGEVILQNHQLHAVYGIFEQLKKNAATADDKNKSVIRILNHVMGSGKTYTALCVISMLRAFYSVDAQDKTKMRALIVVPSAVISTFLSTIVRICDPRRVGVVAIVGDGRRALPESKDYKFESLSVMSYADLKMEHLTSFQTQSLIVLITKDQLASAHGTTYWKNPNLILCQGRNGGTYRAGWARKTTLDFDERGNPCKWAKKPIPLDNPLFRQNEDGQLVAPFHVVVVDEVHQFLNPLGMYNSSIAKIMKAAHVHIGMSGSPIPNCLGDFAMLSQTLCTNDDFEKVSKWSNEQGEQKMIDMKVAKEWRDKYVHSVTVAHLALPIKHVIKLDFDVRLSKEAILIHNAARLDAMEELRRMHQPEHGSNANAHTQRFLNCVKKCARVLVSPMLARLTSQEFKKKSLKDKIDLLTYEHVDFPAEFVEKIQSMRVENVREDEIHKQVERKRVDLLFKKATHPDQISQYLKKLMQIICNEQQNGNRRVILYCPETTPLLLFEEWQNSLGNPTGKIFRIVGSDKYGDCVKLPIRDKDRIAFLHNDGPAVCIMSDAGAVGINLCGSGLGCHTFVSAFLLPWTTAVYEQAQARIWRYGQMSEPTFIELSPYGSYSHAMGQSHQDKKRLAELGLFGEESQDVVDMSLRSKRRSDDDDDAEDEDETSSSKFWRRGSAIIKRMPPIEDDGNFPDKNLVIENDRRTSLAAMKAAESRATASRFKRPIKVVRVAASSQQKMHLSNKLQRTPIVPQASRRYVSPAPDETTEQSETLVYEPHPRDVQPCDIAMDAIEDHLCVSCQPPRLLLKGTICGVCSSEAVLPFDAWKMNFSRSAASSSSALLAPF